MSTLSRMVIAGFAVCWGAGCMVPVETDESDGEPIVDTIDAEPGLTSNGDELRVVHRSGSQGEDAALEIPADDFDADSVDVDYAEAVSPNSEATTSDDELSRARGNYVAGPDPDPWHHLYATDRDEDDDQAGPDPDPWEPQADSESIEDDG